MLPLRDADRVKVLSAVDRTGPRYRLRRVLSITASVGVLVLVPALHVVRMDVWGGEHWLLGERVSFITALKGFVVAMGVLYGGTFVSNMLFGRFFCGWGCPVGHVSRLGEEVAVRGKTRRQRVVQHALGALFVASFLAACMSWWVDPRVLVDGSPTARLVTLGILLALAGGGFCHAFFWQFTFCRSVCPIGIYYLYVTSRAPVGIAFDKASGACVNCHSCEKVCPVDLDPRTFGDESAFHVDDENRVGRNNDAECLRCGDCVEACRMIFAKKKGILPPLRLGRILRSSKKAASKAERAGMDV